MKSIIWVFLKIISYYINFQFLITLKILEQLNKTTVCENRDLNIKCPSDKVINIEYAMFGRVSHSKCRSLSYLSPLIDKCASTDAFDYLKNLCDLKNSCGCNVNSKKFLDPCFNYPKYLDLKYTCL